MYFVTITRTLKADQNAQYLLGFGGVESFEELNHAVNKMFKAGLIGRWETPKKVLSHVYLAIWKGKLASSPYGRSDQMFFKPQKLETFCSATVGLHIKDGIQLLNHLLDFASDTARARLVKDPKVILTESK